MGIVIAFVVGLIAGAAGWHWRAWLAAHAQRLFAKLWGRVGP